MRCRSKIEILRGRTSIHTDNNSFWMDKSMKLDDQISPSRYIHIVRATRTHGRLLVLTHYIDRSPQIHTHHLDLSYMMSVYPPFFEISLLFCSLLSLQVGLDFPSSKPIKDTIKHRHRHTVSMAHRGTPMHQSQRMAMERVYKACHNYRYIFH